MGQREVLHQQLLQVQAAEHKTAIQEEEVQSLFKLQQQHLAPQQQPEEREEQPESEVPEEPVGAATEMQVEVEVLDQQVAQQEPTQDQPDLPQEQDQLALQQEELAETDESG